MGRQGTGAVARRGVRCVLAGGLAAVAAAGLGATGGPASTDAAPATPVPSFAFPDAPVEAQTVVARLPEPAPPPPAPAPPAAPPPAPPPAVQAGVPIDPPTNPYAVEPEVVLGTIEIPALGLAAPLRSGISLHTIDRGPSHWPGSALPGEVGNTVVAGHRVTNTRPFRHIDQLVAGDEVVFTVGGVRTTYAVEGAHVVTPDDMWIVDPTPTPTVTLFACHPPGSARYRYVVTASLVRTEGPVPG